VVREVAAMWKAVPPAAFILALLFSALATGNFVQLGAANPWYEDRWTDPPVILLHSPTNETYRDDVLLNFSVIKPEKWKSNPTVYLGTPTRYGDIQQLDFVRIEVDGKLYRLIEVHSNLSSPFSYSEDLTNLRDGMHSLRIYAYGTGVVEGCEWKPSTSVEINSSSDVVDFRLDRVFLRILLSVENKTYNTSDVPLNFTVNESVSQMSYVLDGQGNVTFYGNTTLAGLVDGSHSLMVYATDAAGNVGSSGTVYFSVETPGSIPTALVATASGASVAVIGVGLLVYFRKRNHQP
jgi:hypothetical protein